MKFSTASSIALVAALAAATPVPAIEERDLPAFTINKIAYAGSGCPAGTINILNTADPGAITFQMKGYVARIGPNEPITSTRKNCQINLDVAYPSGWQYSVVKARYIGLANLDAGVTGVQKATYYFSGQTAQTSAETTFRGPYLGPYDLTDVIDVTKINWSPCGQAAGLNINSQLRLTSTNKWGEGELSTNFEQIHQLQWRRC